MRARSLRQLETEAERRLWGALRNRRLSGLKFVRQHAIGTYVADFVCRDAMLVIEVDGSQHEEHVDAARTAFLNTNGYAVLRFWNNEVLADLDSVLTVIAAVVEHGPSPGWRYSPATLSPEGRGDDAAPSRHIESHEKLT